VRVVQKNGKIFEYEYKVSEKRIVEPDDEWVFEDLSDSSSLTLSTCWPIGTDLSRLVIRAVM
jgi:sortase A